MQNYLETLLTEKNIPLTNDVSPYVIGFTYNELITVICDLPMTHQKKIRNTLVEIDFKNGDVEHYFKYIAHGHFRAMGLGDYLPNE